jgi:hypothetical protein
VDAAYKVASDQTLKPMPQRNRWSPRSKALLVLGGCLGVGGAGQAQSLDGEPAVPAHLPRPVNLQVLPKDIAEADLGRLMKQYRDELGVSCSYCHIENPESRKLSYAEDDNPRKLTARLMITMVREINEKYLAQLGDRRYAAQVTCGSCHQGQSNPPGFEPR